MRSLLIASVALLATVPAFANPKIHRGPTSPRVTHTAPHVKVSGIDSERATQIQSALVKAGYLTGSPTGEWDATTQAAMEKLQADNGWQTKLVPDARAIIKLGLGPGSTPAPAAASETHTEPFPNTQAN